MMTMCTLTENSAYSKLLTLASTIRKPPPDWTASSKVPSQITVRRTLETVQVAATTWRKPKFGNSWIICKCNIFTVITTLWKWLIIDLQEIPNPLHIIRSASTAQFLCSYGKNVLQIFWQYIRLQILWQYIRLQIFTVRLLFTVLSFIPSSISGWG